METERQGPEFRPMVITLTEAWEARILETILQWTVGQGLDKEEADFIHNLYTFLGNNEGRCEYAYEATVDQKSNELRITKERF